MIATAATAPTTYSPITITETIIATAAAVEVILAAHQIAAAAAEAIATVTTATTIPISCPTLIAATVGN